MKHTRIALILGLCLPLAVSAQNRISGWDTDKITSAEVQFSVPDVETTSFSFQERTDLDVILSFLKGVEFRPWEPDSLVAPEDRECHIVFQGQRDQVYLWSRSACIGKTSFGIDLSVLSDFEDLVGRLGR
ncbi:MAG: hypothetical protein R2751_07050 [Bacteroidales bacterium]